MHTSLKHLFCGILLIWIFSGCNKETSTPDDGFNPAVAKTILNEKYGTGTRQVADIYLPANRTGNTPIVILLHGGSWSEGDKTDLNDYIALIRAQWPEAALLNMNYTLANGTAANYHPAQMNDINRLLEYIDTKSSLWQIGSNIGITGVSAGAHLGMLYSYAFNASKKIKAVVSAVGPADFSDPFYTSNPIFQLIANNLLGKTWAQDPDLHKAVSPALRITATSPPTFLAYAGLDPLVPLSNATTLRNRLQANGVTHTYVEYPTEGHELSQTSINNLIPQVIGFLKTNL